MMLTFPTAFSVSPSVFSGHQGDPSSQGQGCTILGCRCHRNSRIASNLGDLAIYLGGYITSLIKASEILLSTQATHCQDKRIRTCSGAEDFPTQISKEKEQ